MTLPVATLLVCVAAAVLPASTQDTARLAGVVKDAQSRPQPVAGAIVTLTGTEIPNGRAAITDDQGRFSFDRLPAGQFSLSSSKPAYLKSTYGAVRPGGRGTRITLAAGQELTEIELTMPHGAAISGTLRDQRGAPVSGIQVSVILTSATSTAPPRIDPVNTDDRGAYRVFGLTPGSYLVAVSPRSSGGLGEVGIMSATEVDAALARLRQRSAAPGAAAPASRDSSPSSIVRPTSTFSTAPVYYPGVTSAAAATVITLGLGDDRAGIDVIYQLARSSVVSGTISGAGASQNVGVFLTPAGSIAVPASFGAGPMLARRTGNGDGPFVFTNVTPGKYTLMARTTPPPPTGARGAAPLPPSVTAALSATALFAMSSIEVDGQDITSIALALQPALRVSGTVSLQTINGSPPPDFARMTLRLSSASGETSGPMPVVLNGLAVSSSQTLISAVTPDGKFVFDGVIPGSYRILTLGIPAVWWPRSAMLDGKDLLDLHLEVGTNEVAGIQMTLSDQHTQLAGRLLEPSGAPANGYYVVAISADRTHWLPVTRRLRSVRPNTDGRYTIDDLPPGDYYLAALTDADSEDWRSPDILTQIIASAVKVTLGDGEKKTQDLRVSR
jgi:carboxypeptidase family protein